MKSLGWASLVAAIAAAVWFSWMFRYEHAGKAVFLDRWTGELVTGFDGERFALRVDPPADAFADLIPRDRDHAGTAK